MDAKQDFIPPAHKTGGFIVPKIEIYKDDLEKLTRRKFEKEELDDALLYVKGELDEFDPKTGKMKIDIKDTNRPDLWSVEGIARELRGHFLIEEELQHYEIENAKISLEIDKSVERVRPKIVAAVVRGLQFNDRAIEQMIQLQEKVALTFGRRRKEAAIGIYDLARIKGPIKYKTFKDYDIKFVPLDFESPMSPSEILKNHPKGKEFGHLIEGKDYPIIIDSIGNVLSMPPVINSRFTGKVTEETKDVFVEVTGYDLRIISLALNVVVTALAERGGIVEAVNMIYPKEKFTTPKMEENEILVSSDNIRKILGLDISDQEISKLLKQCRLLPMKKGKRFVVKYPAYRNDIMHERDIIEDVAIAFGFNDMEPDYPKISTIGAENDFEKWSNRIKDLGIGIGLQEVLTFILTNKSNLFEKMNMRDTDICEIENPVSSSWSSLRTSIIPGMLDFLSKNKHAAYPQEIFEVGDCIIPDKIAETRTKDIRKLAVAISDVQAGYERISGIADALLHGMGLKYKLIRTEHESFINGRVAEISIGGIKIGILGEIHPQVLENWNLEKPVIALEINLSEIYNILKG